MIKQRIFWVRTNFCTGFARVFEKTTLQTLVLDIPFVLDISLFTGMILTDLQKAFDTTDHPILLKKIKYLGFSKNTVTWFKSYLWEQKFKININTNYSSPSNLLCVIPQGSILGPLLFLLYINDLPRAVVSDSLLYDDTCIVFQYKSKIDIEKQLIRDLWLIGELMWLMICELMWLVLSLSIHFGQLVYSLWSIQLV